MAFPVGWRWDVLIGQYLMSKRPSAPATPGDGCWLAIDMPQWYPRMARCPVTMLIKYFGFHSAFLKHASDNCFLNIFALNWKWSFSVDMQFCFLFVLMMPSSWLVDHFFSFCSRTLQPYDLVENAHSKYLNQLDFTCLSLCHTSSHILSSSHMVLVTIVSSLLAVSLSLLMLLPLQRKFFLLLPPVLVCSKLWSSTPRIKPSSLNF